MKLCAKPRTRPRTPGITLAWLALLGVCASDVRPAFAQAGSASGSSDAPNETPAEGAGSAGCVRAYESAQLARRDERLLDARRELRLCGGETCPAVLRRDCVEWLGQTEAGIPTLVLEAKTDGGAVFDVAASIDGRRVTTALDGRPIEVDPGLHRVTFERAGLPPIEQRIILREGEKNRLLVAAWTTPKGPPVSSLPLLERVDRFERTERPVPPGVYVASGIALLGFVDFAIAAALGESLRNQLAASGCAPFCSRGQTDALRTRYIVADIGLGIGVAELATAVVLFVTRPERRVVAPAAAGISPGGFRLEIRSSDAIGTFRASF
ncbi:MAG TPA: hypothetical protein VK841_05455 [Polyangiaceae bacterium]|nr:hypothetical protein [Polyangiaceae bacterium]